MKVIGVVGGSGAGKSLFCSFLEKNGIPWLNTDMTAREVVGKGSACLSELCDAFGGDILLPDGSLNRKKLANIAFSDKNKHALLNKITHKYICKKIVEWVEEQRSKGHFACTVDAPLLFESGLDEICNLTVAVIAPEEKRIARITRRDGIDEAAARTRIAAQISQSELSRRCDLTVENSADENALEKKAAELAYGIRRDCI